jgi:hypothetical protein
MSPEEPTRRSLPTFSQEHPDGHESAPASGRDAEAQLALARGGKHTREEREGVGGSSNVRGVFAQQTWHVPYAEALLETDPGRKRSAISTAKRAILNRYLELCTAKQKGDETRDLGKAVDALKELSSGKTVAFSDKDPHARNADTSEAILQKENPVS